MNAANSAIHLGPHRKATSSRVGPVYAAGEAVTFGSSQAITTTRIVGVYAFGYAFGPVLRLFFKEQAHAEGYGQ
jgi:hypothetical protein